MPDSPPTTSSAGVDEGGSTQDIARQSPVSGGFLSVKENDSLLACRSYILSALTAAMERRTARVTWEQDERMAVATSANEWAMANGIDQRVTVDDVKHIEVLALGHVDYATKLSLYVAEYVFRLDSGVNWCGCGDEIGAAETNCATCELTEP